MDLTGLMSWLDNTGIHDFVVDNSWVWPTLEVFHFLGLCLLLGSLIFVDLRVVGYNKTAPIEPIHAFVPIAITGFAINAFTGLLFVFGDPFRYFPNIAFQFKMLCIFLAGLNVLYFELVVHPKIKQGADGEGLGLDAKIVAGASLVLWICVIIGGRMIPYVEY